MDAQTPTSAATPSNGLSVLERWALWFVASLLLTSGVAWIAFQIQQEQIAPAVLFPLLVGAALGAGYAVVLRACRLTGVRGAVVCATLWGLLAVVGQDYIGYRRHARVFDAEASRQDRLDVLASGAGSELRPEFASYLSRVVGQHAVWWTLDVALTGGAAWIATCVLAKHQPAHTSFTS